MGIREELAARAQYAGRDTVITRWRGRATPKQIARFEEYVTEFRSLRAEGVKIGWNRLGEMMTQDEALPGLEINGQTLKRSLGAG